MRKLTTITLALMLVLCLAACGTAAPEAPVQTAPATEAPVETAPAAEATEAPETEDEQTGLADIEALLGMTDEESSAYFGGGEENWTADKSFYIGRSFDIELNGKAVVLHTSCDNDKLINSVSIWLNDESQPATEDDAESWVAYLNAYAGSEAEYDGTSSESGSKVWRWKLDETFMALHWTGDILSLSMNPAVGELN